MIDTMHNDFRTERIGYTIIYLVENTDSCGITKLNKLLYITDFLAFRKLGKSITGYQYEAWELGPTPQPFYKDFKKSKDNEVPEYLRNYINREVIQKTEEEVFNKLTPKKPFNSDYFSKYELDILTSVAKKYKTIQDEDIVKLSHKTIPFKKAFELGKNNPINYLDAIENDAEVFVGKSLPKEDLTEYQNDNFFLEKVLS
jgi:uncharacterized phage-associated protein